MLAIFLELNSKRLYQSLGKEKESCCLVFTFSAKRDRHFHVVVDKEMNKVVLCTCRVVVLLTKPIAFLPFSLPSPSFFGLLSSRNFATMATWRNDFSSLLGLIYAPYWLPLGGIILIFHENPCHFYTSVPSPLGLLAKFQIIVLNNPALKLSIAGHSRRVYSSYRFDLTLRLNITFAWPLF